MVLPPPQSTIHDGAAAAADTVTDSTDWLNTPLSCLAPLESSLRCQVCKETFITPMITSCSHTFCSLCIRRYLSQEGKCPSCRTPDQEMRLRHNWALQELVEIWGQRREEILDFAKKGSKTNPRANEVEGEGEGESVRPRKRRRVVGKDSESGPPMVQSAGLSERRSTRSQSSRVASQGSPPSQSVPRVPSTTYNEVPDSSDGGSIYTDSPIRTTSSRFEPSLGPIEANDGLVGCPSCNRRMREALINSHLDRCLQGLATPPPPPQQQHHHSVPTNHDRPLSPPRTLQAGTIAYTTTKPSSTTANQRLPTINYSLLTETALRRKLKDLGIPNQGNKELMRKRHTEWMNLWNANSDSLHPVPKPKLLRELDIWERNLNRDERQRNSYVTTNAGAGAGGGGGNNNGGNAVGGGGGVGGLMDKEFDRETYMRSQAGDFDELIRKAKESRKVKAKQINSDNGNISAGVASAAAVAISSEEKEKGDQGVEQRQAPAVMNGVHDEQAAETLVPGTPPPASSATATAAAAASDASSADVGMRNGNGNGSGKGMDLQMPQ